MVDQLKAKIRNRPRPGLVPLTQAAAWRFRQASGCREGPPGGRAGVAVRPAGFTLVEMLVAVALIVLLMSMFAEVFRLASDAMTAQRGLAENAQRARSVAIVIRADLDKRTFRNVVPFFPGEQADTSPTPFSNRRGYFYISENDPNDDTDDVLQFTVDASIRTKNRDETPYFGRSTWLAPHDPNNPCSPLPPNLIRDFNQPEADDGQVEPDGTSASPAAEVCYFLRHGNLYRRVLLIRKPLPLAGADAQPTDRNGNDFFLDGQNCDYFADRDNDPSTPPTRSRAFWLDFDFSAHYAGKAIFHGIADLDNSGAGGAFPLAKPAYRFGHNHTDGQPREYVSNGFIGRFTHQETSFAEDLNGNGQLDPGEDLNGNGVLDEPFGYPQWIRSAGNPMDRATNLVLDANGVVGERSDALFTGPRRSEDLLMTNVYSFDVKVWDEAIGKFVDVGHSFKDANGNDVGDFNLSGQLNPDYGPAGPTGNRVFDTWHPQLPNQPHLKWPPFVPRYYDSPSSWQPNAAYVNEDINLNGVLDSGEDQNGNGRLDVSVVIPTSSSPVHDDISSGPIWAVVYRCVQSGLSGNVEPPWPTTPGSTVADGQVIWQAMYNLKPLKAIQITIRFYDVSSGQLKQMTLVHSLVD